jgi:hypothetical protein
MLIRLPRSDTFDIEKRSTTYWRSVGSTSKHFASEGSEKGGSSGAGLALSGRGKGVLLRLVRVVQ